ncbi:MAG: alpha/beta hydrolase [Oscillospiraceae bacterium]|nr:alpha/beta hydrolase [Oscillospiraceae bacterium]
MEQKKLAVIFPGIGYHKDKPLLYYAARIAQNCGYETISVEYCNMPEKIRGNTEMMRIAAELACQQASEQLQSVNICDYNRILLIGKSIGTIAAAKFAAEHPDHIKEIRYTPLESTFSFVPSVTGSCIAFLGTDDPWSDKNRITKEAAKQNIPLYLYPDCNHSLECHDVIRNIEYLREIMQITSDFIRKA